MDADGSRQSNVSNNEAIDFKPAWSSDGKKIAFVSDRDGDLEIYVMNADGSNSQRLTDNVAVDLNPAWSPDGEKIVFHSNYDNMSNIEIYTMNASDGTGLTRLTNDPEIDSYPDWQPLSDNPNSPRLSRQYPYELKIRLGPCIKITPCQQKK